jgi:hypothetical protein
MCGWQSYQSNLSENTKTKRKPTTTRENLKQTKNDGNYLYCQNVWRAINSIKSVGKTPTTTRTPNNNPKQLETTNNTPNNIFNLTSTSLARTCGWQSHQSNLSPKDNQQQTTKDSRKPTTIKQTHDST